jgi:adenine phosphoribosyltransferase
MADLFRDAGPTVVVSPEVTGFLVGPLVARALRAGFVEAYRAGARRPIAEPMSWAEVPSDHRGENQHLGVRVGLVAPGDRVLVVDDWAATGAQTRALRSLFGDAYLGTAVIVDECPPEVSAELTIRGLLTGDDLP